VVVQSVQDLRTQLPQVLVEVLTLQLDAELHGLREEEERLQLAAPTGRGGQPSVRLTDATATRYQVNGSFRMIR